MTGFAKVTFDAHGAEKAVACAQCGETRCFCLVGLFGERTVPSVEITPAHVALSAPSPAAAADASDDCSHPLVVFGCGDLGTRIASVWRQRKLGRVVGVTRTTKRHSTLVAMGVEPTLVESARAPRGSSMVIAVPPGSGAATHAACVAAAAAQWAKRRRVKGAAQRRGRLILISSGSVYPAPLAGAGGEAAYQRV